MLLKKAVEVAEAAGLLVGLGKEEAEVLVLSKA